MDDFEREPLAGDLTSSFPGSAWERKPPLRSASAAHEGFDWTEIAFWIAVAFLFVAFAFAMPGCAALPEGVNMQSSIVGLKLAPMGDMPNAPKFVLGSSTQHYATPPKADVGPLLNRTQVIAPGLDQTSTVATGPIGEQMGKAGPTLTDSLKILHARSRPELPLELPPAAPQPNSPP